MSNRLNDERSAIVIIMQRLHEGDVSGDILAHVVPFFAFAPGIRKIEPSCACLIPRRAPGHNGSSP
jgi:hypothetical protein